MSAEDGLRAKLIREAQGIAHELLGDWYLRPAVRNAWTPLPVELFPDFKLRTIAEAANERVPPDELGVFLARNGARAHWPNPDLAEEFLLQVATHARPFDEQVANLRGVHDRIVLLDELRNAQLKGTSLDDTLETLERLKPTVEITALPVLSAAELFADLGPEPWLCKTLALQPGNPWMLSGHSGTGKSWLLTDLALAIAGGGKFGTFDVRPGRVRWLHLEGSSRDLKRRVQQLARGRQLGVEELDGVFLASSHPRFNFLDPKLEAQLSRECEGCVMAVIDTFAVAAAGMKENDSSIRQPLDMLARVSEKTGCAFAVIHHHRKDPQDKKQELDAEMAVRGSGAISNAISVGWSTKKMKRTADVFFHTRLSIGKTWYGARPDLIAVAAPSTFAPGAVDLFVREARDSDDAPPEIDNSALDQEIIETVSARPGISLSSLSAYLGKRRPLIAERVRALKNEERLRIDAGDRGSWLLHLNAPA